MNIVGISAFYHDSAVAIVCNGEIIAAAQEERFSRKKHDSGFPRCALNFCLSFADITSDHIDYIVFYDKPFLKFERLIETYLEFAPRGFQSFRKAFPIWVKDKLFLKRVLVKELEGLLGKGSWQQKILFSEHHFSHAASAFYPSPFDSAAVLTMDGVGEWATTSLALGKGNSLFISKEINFPHSIGLLYSAFTYHLGFKVNSGEYKVMGLAPYGEPKYVQTILDSVIDVKSDGSYRLNLDYFDYCTGLTMTNNNFEKLFDVPLRRSDEKLSQKHMDLAASIQTITEEVVLKLTRSISIETGEKNLCLAGGVALNCVANGKILKDGKFDHIWIQPAAGDAGGALGAALAAHHGFLGKSRFPLKGKDQMKGSFLGPSFDQVDIEKRLKELGAVYEVIDETRLLETCVEDLIQGSAIGWFQGRMEFGPRALGSRSILGDARSPQMQAILNLKVKFRESFRPFAPSVLREDLSDWFDLDCDSPYMLLVAEVNKGKQWEMTDDLKKFFGIERLNIPRSEIPAVTHVDYSARIQTVHPDTNFRYYALLKEFKRRTGCPVLVNTSFNVRGEPLVCSPEDAFRCFMGTEIDVLIVGDCYLRKEHQNSTLKKDYRGLFNLD